MLVLVLVVGYLVAPEPTGPPVSRRGRVGRGADEGGEWDWWALLAQSTSAQYWATVLASGLSTVGLGSLGAWVISGIGWGFSASASARPTAVPP